MLEMQQTNNISGVRPDRLVRLENPAGSNGVDAVSGDFAFAGLYSAAAALWFGHRSAAESRGPVGMVSIAEQLNERGIRTARGGSWHVSSVANVLARTLACDQVR